MNRFLPLGHTDSHTLDTYMWGGGGGRGSDIRSRSSIRPICKCRCPPLLFSRIRIDLNLQDITDIMRNALGDFRDKMAGSSGSEDEDSDDWGSDSAA